MSSSKKVNTIRTKMEANEYQDKAHVFSLHNTPVIYPTLGLTGEAGEVADKVKKIIRDDNGEFSFEKVQAIALELGDVLWYVQELAGDLGYTLDEIMQMNLEKLSSRLDRNKIHGSGDNR